MKRIPTGRSVLALGILFLTSTTASATTLYVAANGTNSGSCGSKTDPCRSITQGIAQAAEGDKIIVGPGVYGDLDNDGSFADAGDESPSVVDSTSCMIPITKKVTLNSASGAWATVIDPGPSGAIHAAVCLAAEGVVFGGNGKGFTVQRAGAAATANVRIVNGANGSVVSGAVVSCDGGSIHGISAAVASIQVLGNRVLNCNLGIHSQGSNAVVKGNVASGNTLGFNLPGLGIVFDGNVAAGNGVGLNMGSGTVTRSSFLGNRNYGAAFSSGSLTTSNFVGNGTGPGTPNCGIYNFDSNPPIAGNWWGAATGPGADPADTYCGDASTSSFAEVPFSTKPKGVR